MADVINFHGVTRLDIPTDRVLEAAKGKLEGIVLIGYDHDGQFYFASSYADGAEVLWLLKKAEQALLNVGERDI